MELIQKLLVTGLAVGAWMGAIVLLWLALRRLFRVRRERRHVLRLTNQGNAVGAYQLQVDAAEPGLKFEMRQGKQKLEELPVPQGPLNLADQPASEFEESFAQPAAGMEASDTLPEPDQPAALPAAVSGRALSGFGRSISSGLGYLGRLLPGEAGQVFRQQSAALGRVQSVARQGAQMQSIAQRSLGRLPGQSRSAPANLQTFAPRPAEPLAGKQVTQPARMRPVYLAKTLPVQSGESVEITLRIVTHAPNVSHNRYTYVIRSQLLPLAKFAQAPGTLARKGEVIFPALSSWRLQMPVWLSVLVAVASLPVVVLFLAGLW
jgi:hypothetical protein